jgi:4-hydroxy-tetrahydrodipicolinate synthase
MAKRLKGTGVALVTPFLANGSVDYNALANLVNHVIKGGVDFLVALGTTAETPTLTSDEKKSILGTIIKVCNDRVPVVVGIGGNNTAEVIEQINSYELREVAAILSVTPYYNKPTQEGLYQHYKAIANSTNKSIILYNVPGRTGGNILPATVVRLADDFKNIIGIKEASGNMAQCMELIEMVPKGFKVFSGDDNLTLAHMAIGMEGVISVVANCCPEDFTELVNLAMINKYDKARKVHYRLLPGIDLLFADGNPAGVKFVLNKLGICQNILRLPLVPISEGTAKKMTHFMETIKQHPTVSSD